MKEKTISYVESIKKQPGLLLHLFLYGVMVVLMVGVWRSLEKVFPDGAELGKFAIVARALCLLILIIVAVRATKKTVGRALVLIVLAIALEVGEFGCHWMYARELSSSRMAQAEMDRQKVLNNELANEQAKRVEGVLGKLSDFNRSQTQMAQADTRLYQSTGIRRNRKTSDAPALESLGILTNNSAPVPASTPVSLVNGLVMSSGVQASPRVEDQPEVPLNEIQVLAKWTPRFVVAAILCLIVIFVGTGVVVNSWEWDRNGNDIDDADENLGKV